MPTTMDEFGHGPLSVLARSLVSVFAISGEWLYYGRQLPFLPHSLVISLHINDCGVAQHQPSLEISNEARQFSSCRYFSNVARCFAVSLLLLGSFSLRWYIRTPPCKSNSWPSALTYSIPHPSSGPYSHFPFPPSLPALAGLKTTAYLSSVTAACMAAAASSNNRLFRQAVNARLAM